MISRMGPDSQEQNHRARITGTEYRYRITEAKSMPEITCGAPSLHLPYQIGGNTKS